MTTTIKNAAPNQTYFIDPAELQRQVLEVVNTTAVCDVHTHLFAPEFGELNLHGIDELLTYHYLVAEMFRSTAVRPEEFWQMSLTRKADLVWETLFVENTPLSEAARGVVTVFNAFGLDPHATDLIEAREFFKAKTISEQVDDAFALSNVSAVVMTNDPFDPRESRIWEHGAEIDERFEAALRMDRLLNDWSTTSARLSALGHPVEPGLGGRTISELRSFLEQRITRMKPLYMAVSLPDDFNYPDNDLRHRILHDVVLPVAREHQLPFAVMLGVRRGVNPVLRRAGDGVGKIDIKALERLCAENPKVRFLATILSRENQHELCVVARKFNNLMPFGCWWFLNNPSISSEITRERLELLGMSFIPQHSDASVLQQLIYKWQHARVTIAQSLFEAYEQLLKSGRAVTRREIERDVERLFSGNFRNWVDGRIESRARPRADTDMVTAY
jgi:hypothetical protein